MLFSFLALSPLMGLRPYRDMHMPTFKKQWLGLLAIGALFAVNVSARVSAYIGCDELSLLGMRGS